MPVSSSIRVSDLTLARGDKTLVAGLNLAVESGEILHLTGRNGAGKTTLLEALCGLRRPEQGHISGAVPEQIHWVGHKNALNAALSPTENLRFWCLCAGAETQLIEAACNQLQLKSVRHKPVRMLSTGQKRRTALARLLLQPRCWWLLDEPLAGLDAEAVHLFAKLLASHCAGGGAAIVTSHQALPVECGVVREWRLA